MFDTGAGLNFDVTGERVS